MQGPRRLFAYPTTTSAIMDTMNELILVVDDEPKITKIGA